MKKDKNYRDMLKNLSLVSQIGLSIIAPILLSIYIGQWLDKKLGRQGIFTLIFIVLGAGAGFLNLLKLTGLFNNKRK